MSFLKPAPQPKTSPLAGGWPPQHYPSKDVHINVDTHSGSSQGQKCLSIDTEKHIDPFELIMHPNIHTDTHTDLLIYTHIHTRSHVALAPIHMPTWTYPLHTCLDFQALL